MQRALAEVVRQRISAMPEVTEWDGLVTVGVDNTGKNVKVSIGDVKQAGADASEASKSANEAAKKAEQATAGMAGELAKKANTTDLAKINGKPINNGGQNIEIVAGEEVVVSDTEPKNPEAKMWINPQGKGVDVTMIPEAPKDGKAYVRKDGAWYEVKPPEGGYNRSLFEADGATWNGSVYILNGMELTEEDMTVSHVAGKQIGLGVYSENFSIRTNISFSGGSLYSDTSHDITTMFRGCVNLEYAKFNKNGRPTRVKRLFQTFAGCSKMRKTDMLDVHSCTDLRDAYKECIALVNSKISMLKADISFADSPLLSVSDDEESSAGYLIIKAVGGSPEKPITFIFAKPVYDKIVASKVLSDTAKTKHISIAQAV